MPDIICNILYKLKGIMHVYKSLSLFSPSSPIPLLYLEMVLRFDMAPRSGQRSILQYMVPWLSNIELVEECHPPPTQSDYSLEEDNSNLGLRGSGWGSAEGTKVVLHNLFYITAKVSSIGGSM